MRGTAESRVSHESRTSSADGPLPHQQNPIENPHKCPRQNPSRMGPSASLEIGALMGIFVLDDERVPIRATRRLSQWGVSAHTRTAARQDTSANDSRHACLASSPMATAISEVANPSKRRADMGPV